MKMYRENAGLSGVFRNFEYMKIAYIMHSFDNSNAKKPMELGWFITTNLERQGCEIEYIEVGRPILTLFFKVRAAVHRKLGKKSNWFREPFLLKRLAKTAAKKLAKSSCGAVFSFGSIPVSFLETKKPIVFWTDASFVSLIDVHPHVTGLSDSAIRKGHSVERDAFRRASKIIFTSEWAANEAKQYYDIPKEKIEVITFGPNVDGLPERGQIVKMIGSKSREELHLLWIAINWELKDGPKAIEIARELNKSVKTTLHIVGVPRQVSQEEAPFAKFYGFLQKGDTEAAKTLGELFAKCHFLIHPTKFDTLGQVLIEANSYGLPAVTHSVGGVPEVVRNGANGLIYNLNSAPETIAGEILYIFKDEDAYRKLSESSRTDYENRTSWEAAAKRVVGILNKEKG